MENPLSERPSIVPAILVRCIRRIMFLRFSRRTEDGNEQLPWAIVENRRCAPGKVVQRPLLDLGENVTASADPAPAGSHTWRCGAMPWRCIDRGNMGHARRYGAAGGKRI
jgi:hypothetical protein